MAIHTTSVLPAQGTNRHAHNASQVGCLGGTSSMSHLSRAICSVTAHSRALMGPGKAVMKTPSFSWHSYPLHTNSVARTVAQYRASAA